MTERSGKKEIWRDGEEERSRKRMGKKEEVEKRKGMRMMGGGEQE